MKTTLLVLALLLPGCASTTPATFCSWIASAEAACNAVTPIPVPPPAVAAEIVSRSASVPGAVTTSCEYIRLAAAACRAGQPVPSASPAVARSLTGIPSGQ